MLLVSYLPCYAYTQDTTAACCFSRNSNKGKKQEAKPKEREIFNWVNPKTKEVRLPDELTNAFKKNKKVAEYFHSLAFSHKKEYIEWIVTAKKEETKKKRVEGTIERLGKLWKNPANN